MNVLSLFSGIGGIDLGLERAGMRTVAFCEREPAAQHWLREHWPGVPIHDDVCTLSGESFRGSVDLIAGGFPCQPFSVAGKQKGTEDERHLWPHFARLIGEIRPRWVLAENVPGLRTIAADIVLEDLEGQGYTCWPLVVGVDDVGGPHRRKRVWIVAHSDGRRFGESCRHNGGQKKGRSPNNASASGLADASRRGLGTDGRASRLGGYPDSGRTLVGSPTSEGLEGQRPDAGQPQESEPRHAGPRMADPEGSRRAQQGDGRIAGSWAGCDGPRWPARPGEPQHEWEAPRLAYSHSARRKATGTGLEVHAGRELEQGCSPLGMADAAIQPLRSAGQSREVADPREPESPMGGAADGLPRGLAGFTPAHRREALKALGNAVVPQVVEVIGRAILECDRRGIA